VEPNRERLEEFTELLKHPGWQVYLELVEDEMLKAFQQIFYLESSKPESFIKFVELKGRIDQLRNITYDYERQMAVKQEDIEAVDKQYTSRFKALLKKIFMGAKHG
jgi:hypothetical protein